MQKLINSPDTFKDEQWRPIPGFEGWYSVSNCGRIRRDKQSKGTQAGRVLSLVRRSDGYCQVILSVNQKHSQRLVYAADDTAICECDSSVDDGTRATDEANAAFIVRAANAHDDLVKACEAAEQRITEISPAGYVAPELWTIRAALAKARGEA